VGIKQIVHDYVLEEGLRQGATASIYRIKYLRRPNVRTPLIEQRNIRAFMGRNLPTYCRP